MYMWKSDKDKQSTKQGSHVDLRVGMERFSGWLSKHYLQSKVLAHSVFHVLPKRCTVPHDMPWPYNHLKF